MARYTDVFGVLDASASASASAWPGWVYRDFVPAGCRNSRYNEGEHVGCHLCHSHAW